MQYHCHDCTRVFPDPKWELPNRALMTMDDNVLRRQMVPKCPRCGSTNVHKEP